ncbi:VanZ family protein [Polaribacter sp.]|nr:VanZ family protein [Polaribacter sp.]MDA9092761.1 VanZ family protein [Polaribacter sp.]MDB4010068.1 VanZ family protein [Polaribacter sp.]
MQQRIKHLLQASKLWFAIAITICIAYLSLIKTNNFPKIAIYNIDKLYHLIAYFGLTFSWLLALKKPKYKYKVLIACVLYGIIIEVLQATLTIYRTGELFDFLANSVGVLLALLIFNLFLKKSI